MIRAEKVAMAQEFRARGFKVREIAERMGVARSTAGTWLGDPYLSKQKARRERYRSRCIDCGGVTDGSGGYKDQRERCLSCAAAYQHDSRYWTPERIIEAIQEFARRYGRKPVATDWNPAQARSLGLPDRAERYYTDGCWPAHNTVQGEFGTWNAAIEAAGFLPNHTGHYGRPGEDPALCQEIRERYEAGERTYPLAREYGCSPDAIRERVRRAGGTVRPPTRLLVAA